MKFAMLMTPTASTFAMTAGMPTTATSSAIKAALPAIETRPFAA